MVPSDSMHVHPLGAKRTEGAAVTEVTATIAKSAAAKVERIEKFMIESEYG